MHYSENAKPPKGLRRRKEKAAENRERINPENMGEDEEEKANEEETANEEGNGWGLEEANE